MKHEYKIRFSFWKIEKCGYYEMIDIDEGIYKVERTRFVRAETKEQAKRKLKHSWSIPIEILSIEENYNERERARER